MEGSCGEIRRKFRLRKVGQKCQNKGNFEQYIEEVFMLAVASFVFYLSQRNRNLKLFSIGRLGMVFRWPKPLTVGLSEIHKFLTDWNYAGIKFLVYSTIFRDSTQFSRFANVHFRLLSNVSLCASISMKPMFSPRRFLCKFKLILFAIDLSAHFTERCAPFTGVLTSLLSPCHPL